MAAKGDPAMGREDRARLRRAVRSTAPRPAYVSYVVKKIRSVHGIPRTMRGPAAFASHSGSRFHVSIASLNFGFFGL